jgi:hypothetical protein
MSDVQAVHVTVFRLTRHEMSDEQRQALQEAIGNLLQMHGYAGTYSMSIYEHKGAVANTQEAISLIEQAAREDAGGGKVPPGVSHVIVVEPVLPIQMLDELLRGTKKAMQEGRIPPCHVIRARMKRDNEGNFSFECYEEVRAVTVETVQLTKPKA